MPQLIQKIAIVLPDLHGGGVERIRLVLAGEFVRMGYCVEFVLMRACGSLLTEAQGSFTVVDLGCSRTRDLPFALARYLKRHRPDSLCVAMWPLTVIAPLMRLVGYRGHILVSEHNTLSIQYRNWGRVHRTVLRSSMAVSYRLATARVGVSAGVVEDLAILSGLSRHMFEVVHNPVSPRTTPSFLSIQQAEKLWNTPRGLRILTVGSMKDQKNHSLLLRVVARIGRSDLKLMFVGTGAKEQDLRSLADDLGLSAQVIFAGFHSDPTAFYQTADLFVLPSDYEGFGNVIVEALRCGLPVVSTDCPSGPREILDGGRYGQLVAVGDEQAMATAIQSSLNEKTASEVLRKRASEFSSEKAARAYLRLMGYKT